MKYREHNVVKLVVMDKLKATCLFVYLKRSARTTEILVCLRTYCSLTAKFVELELFPW